MSDDNLYTPPPSAKLPADEGEVLLGHKAVEAVKFEDIRLGERFVFDQRWHPRYGPSPVFVKLGPLEAFDQKYGHMIYNLKDTNPDVYPIDRI